MVQLAIFHTKSPTLSSHLLKILPSHIKDTKHFLNLIEKLPSLPTSGALVAADILPLHTLISHDDGIETVVLFIEEGEIQASPTHKLLTSPYSVQYPRNPQFHS